MIAFASVLRITCHHDMDRGYHAAKKFFLAFGQGQQLSLTGVGRRIGSGWSLDRLERVNHVQGVWAISAIRP